MEFLVRDSFRFFYIAGIKLRVNNYRAKMVYGLLRVQVWTTLRRLFFLAVTIQKFYLFLCELYFLIWNIDLFFNLLKF
jgi:hypothetical protein